MSIPGLDTDCWGEFKVPSKVWKLHSSFHFKSWPEVESSPELRQTENKTQSHQDLQTPAAPLTPSLVFELMNSLLSSEAVTTEWTSLISTVQRKANDAKTPLFSPPTSTLPTESGGRHGYNKNVYRTRGGVSHLCCHGYQISSLAH